ncbi:MAG TPA: hypothetical protein VM243_00590 [Phycisphaerae bacterium]|nr:hypothetical protein [Phycisphaerae bacterium]
MRRQEAQMIEPVRTLMHQAMGIHISTCEFRGGYGIADLVGAAICSRACKTRAQMGLAGALDHHHLVEVLLALRPGVWNSREVLLGRLSVSESTLRRRVLPRLRAHGLIERDGHGAIRLRAVPPPPTEYVVAVEAKQTRWRQAIVQARRYTFFADRTYIALWSHMVVHVDRSLLYRHRLGMISVEAERATLVVEAPLRKPRKGRLNRYCAEYLYGLSLNQGLAGG